MSHLFHAHAVWLLVLLCLDWGVPLRSRPPSPAFVQRALDLIHEQAVLSKVVGQYTSVKANGQNSYQCLCPFHKDKNPSMSLSDDKGLYHCFSCGEGGDVVKFVRNMEQLSFTEAIVKTLSLSGLTVPDSDKDGDERQQLSTSEVEMLRKRERIEDALEAAAKFYSSKLLVDVKAGAARTHLINRRIKPQTAFKFQLGYAPVGGAASLTANLTASGFSLDELVSAGLTVKGEKQNIAQHHDNNFDRFRDRLVVPICNAQGKVVAFGGRLLDAPTPSRPKYLNSPETPIFKKSVTLFGLDVARRAMSAESVAVIVEGYFDVIALHDVGVVTAVGAMGTSLTREQFLTAARASKGKVILLFDADEAGQIATQRVIENILPAVMTSSGMNIDLRIASLPSVGESQSIRNALKKEEVPKDPADVCLRLGAGAGEAMQNALSKAIGWKQWSVDRIILTGLRELDDKNRDASVPARIDLENVPNQSSPSSPSLSSSSLADGNSPMLAALGLESIRPPPVASIESLLAAPDFFASTVASLSRFLGSLPDASDRTILAYYCAERLAGGRPSFRLQLETDLLSSAERIREANLPKPAASSQTQRKQMSEGPITSAPTSLAPRPPTTTTIAQQQHQQQQQQQQRADPALRQSSFQQRPQTSYQIAVIRHVAPTGGGEFDSATEAALILTNGIDIDMPQSTFPRKNFQTTNEVLWSVKPLESQLSIPIESDRTRGAELQLLSLFVFVPTLRPAIHAAATRIEAAVAGMLDVWSQPGQGELWSVMRELNETKDADDFRQRVEERLVACSASPAAIETFRTVLAQQLVVGSQTETECEYILAGATQILIGSRSKSKLANALRSVDIDSSELSEVAGQASSFDLTSQMGRTHELWETEMRRKKIDDRSDSITKDNGGTNFFELLRRHSAPVDSPDFSAVAGDGNSDADADEGVVARASKYDFDFNSDQLHDRVVGEGERSEEEEYEIERQGLLEEATRNRDGKKGASAKLPNFTIGLDDYYDDSQPKKTWSKRT